MVDLKMKTTSKKKEKQSRTPRTGVGTSMNIWKMHIIDSSGGSDVRGTPPDTYVEYLKKLNYYPRMDYCGDTIHHMCESWITEEKNLFRTPMIWNGFMNPEYSNIKYFMKYATDSWKQLDINLLVLTYAKTDTIWWHEFVEPYRLSGDAEVYFHPRRLRFTDELGWKMENNATDPSVFIFYKSKLFPSEVFCPFKFY